MPATSPKPPWSIHFFQQVGSGGVPGACPAADYLDSIPEEVAAEIEAILRAVAEAPPVSFKGGGKWVIMHGVMKGIYEVRSSRGKFNYRLFCVLIQESAAFEGPAIVCLGGLVKPVRSPANERDYATILEYRDEFRATPSVT